MAEETTTSSVAGTSQLFEANRTAILPLCWCTLHHMASSHCIERCTTCFWCHLLLAISLGSTLDTDAGILEFTSLSETSLVAKEEGSADEAAKSGTKRRRCRQGCEWK